MRDACKNPSEDPYAGGQGQAYNCVEEGAYTLVGGGVM